MPRIRSIKPVFWNDERLAGIPLQARLVFIGTWNLADDYGVLLSNPKWIKAQLFPYDDNIRVDSVSQWIDQLVKARMLIPLILDNEGYLYIRTFRIHQKIDKPSKTGFISTDKLTRVLKMKESPVSFEDHSESIRRLFETELGSSKEEMDIGDRKVLSPNGSGGEAPPLHARDLEKQYDNISPKTMELIFQFIKNEKPTFIQPFVDLWNLFANKYSMPKVKTITEVRQKRFKKRISEAEFNMPEILKRAKNSDFILSNKWFGFDWIINSQSNYLKVIEGNFDNGKPIEKMSIGVSGTTLDIYSDREKVANGTN